MDKSKYQQFVDYVKPEIEELQEDLRGLPLTVMSYKVGDFGCGWGYITWCLMHEIPNSECIGIDKFDPENPPTLSKWRFSLDNVQSLFRRFGVEPSPDFRQGDIVKGENLPSDFDIVYCKRVLFNIFVSNDGCAKLNQAIHHIADALKYNGWFCLIEIQEAQFKSVLEENLVQAKLEFTAHRSVNRPYKTLEKDCEKYPYMIYQCKKAKQL